MRRFRRFLLTSVVFVAILLVGNALFLEDDDKVAHSPAYDIIALSLAPAPEGSPEVLEVEGKLHQAYVAHCSDSDQRHIATTATVVGSAVNASPLDVLDALNSQEWPGLSCLEAFRAAGESLKVACAEDDPCWNCQTMGNKTCGPVPTEQEIEATPERDRPDVALRLCIADLRYPRTGIETCVDDVFEAHDWPRD